MLKSAVQGGRDIEGSAGSSLVCAGGAMDKFEMSLGSNFAERPVCRLHSSNSWVPL